MIYLVRHVTTYRYEAPVQAAQCTLRLAPDEGPEQRLLSHEVDVAPTGSLRAERQGPFGSKALSLAVSGPHDRLRIEARSRVEVRRPPALARGAGPAWERVREEAAEAGSLYPSSPVHHLFPSRRVTPDEGIAAYARESFPSGRPIAEAGMDLARRIRADFAFDPHATEVTTAPAEAFQRRRGVCQDFAHVMIAGLRGLGLPAAYVSGYIRTDPPPGRPRLQGADATHAWVSLWCGGELGWIGLDPTNAVAVENDHVVLATGRDYADVSPVDGVIFGGGAQAVHVAVDVIAEG